MKNRSSKKSLKQKLTIALSLVNALNMAAPIALPYVNVARNVRTEGGQTEPLKDIARAFYSKAQANTPAYTPEVPIIGTNTVEGETIPYGGTQNVLSSGTASNTLVDGGGVQNVLSSGRAEGTTINDVGVQNVLSSGTAKDTTINGGGTQNVNSGGMANDTTVSGSNATQNVNSGGRASNITVGSGGRVTSTHVESNAVQHVYGGMVISTTLGGSGACQNLSGGVASGTIISATDASQNISGGATAVDTVISSGKQEVFSGGVAGLNGDEKIYHTYIQSGGVQEVLNSGFAFNTIVSSGGKMLVASGEMIGGTNVVLAGAVVSGGTLNDWQHVYGTASGVTVDRGMQMVHEGGTVYNTILSGTSDRIGEMRLLGTKEKPAVASNTSVLANGVQNVGFVADNGEITYGVAYNTVVNGGVQEIWPDSIASNTIVSNGEQNLNGGTSFGTIVSADGKQTVGNESIVTQYGGTSFGTIVSAGGTQTIPVKADARVIGTTVKDGGIQNVCGGTAEDTTVEGGGYQEVWGMSDDLARAGNTTILKGGTQKVKPFSVVEGTTVRTGATQIVSGLTEEGEAYYAQAENTTVETGGTQKSDAASPWQLDLNLTGFAGKKKGVSGGISVAWMF